MPPLIKDRMDITGVRWGLAGAEAILKLRAIIANGDFEEYWCFHLAQEHTTSTNPLPRPHHPSPVTRQPLVTSKELHPREPRELVHAHRRRANRASRGRRPAGSAHPGRREGRAACGQMLEADHDAALAQWRLRSSGRAIRQTRPSAATARSSPSTAWSRAASSATGRRRSVSWPRPRPTSPARARAPAHAHSRKARAAPRAGV